MPLKLLRKYFVVLSIVVFQATISFGQNCTNLGQTPSTAFPVFSIGGSYMQGEWFCKREMKK
jgi:hypothetical protein